MARLASRAAAEADDHDVDLRHVLRLREPLEGTVREVDFYAVLLNQPLPEVRDLAALRGTYRLIPETDQAVHLLTDMLQEAKVRTVRILLDEPVSNSGRLKAKIADIAEGCPFDLDIRIQRDVDRELYDKELVVTSDSIILDHCRSWVNLTGEYLHRVSRTPLQVWEQG